MKVLVDTFNSEKALVRTLSGHCETLRRFLDSSNSSTCRVVCHDPDVVVGVGLEADDEGLVLGAPAQHVLGVLHLAQVLPPVLDTVPDQLAADLKIIF